MQGTAAGNRESRAARHHYAARSAYELGRRPQGAGWGHFGKVLYGTEGAARAP